MQIRANVVLHGLLRFLNLTDVTSYAGMLVVDNTGNVRRSINPAAVAYQISGIVGNTFGLINLAGFIGTNTGSYTVRVDMQFADLNNAAYRLSANRMIEFSFVSYQSGQSIIHTEPEIMLVQHSGLIVRLSDGVVFDLKAQDIDCSTELANNMLRVNIRNNIGNSAIPAANASISCRYNISVKRFDWVTGGDE